MPYDLYNRWYSEEYNNVNELIGELQKMVNSFEYNNIFYHVGMDFTWNNAIFRYENIEQYMNEVNK